VLEGQVLRHLLAEDQAEEKVRTVQEKGCQQGQTESRKDTHLIRKDKLCEEPDSLYKAQTGYKISHYLCFLRDYLASYDDYE